MSTSGYVELAEGRLNGWVGIEPRHQQLEEFPTRPESYSARVWVDFSVASNSPPLKLELLGSGGRMYTSWEVSPTSPVREYYYPIGPNIVGLRVTNPHSFSVSYYTYHWIIEEPYETVNHPYASLGAFTLLIGAVVIGVGLRSISKNRPS